MNRVSEQLQGAEGSVYTDSDNKAILKDHRGNVKYEHQGTEDPNPYQVEHDELFASLLEGKVINNAEFGAKSTMAAILGRMATYSGKVVGWDEALASNIRLVPDPENWSWDAAPPTVPDKNGKYPIPTPGVTKVI